ncbi:hypothetical protein PFICI_14255 [Pestalotiopsis fici W106-1]|uniref:Isotrichodermin C-15 hydroxylase n=1 Tax=Pestalotiopsis fici (strain W106-1 / CGMCC3.15140) TaxID=1229662 RepID=W3WKX2_PESFW|nr:uncharacterized protein PFICI_14255 [Pestalotiopsis fici W106-1]ETS74389.1 hypothetical protein PFICI_14255 [Pestalotiopsis fici W106-1]
MFWGIGIGFVLLYLCGYATYNLFMHPLSAYPGPLFMRVSRLGYSYKSIMGTLTFDMLELHERYGDVVRIAPNELAFSHPQAWKDIMGHHHGSRVEMEKYDHFYRPVSFGPVDVVSANREEHSRLRRLMSHGFSDRSMQAQQPIINQYIDLFIQRIHEHCFGSEKPVDLAAWFNFTTFDIIGDLAFGEPFGCLKKSDYHPWVKTIFEMARAGTVLQATSHWSSLQKLMLMMVPRSMMDEHRKHAEMAKLKLSKRLARESERSDLVDGLLKEVNGKSITLQEVQANASVLVIAGSETTATLLSGVTFLLLVNPDALKTLTNEVRDAFQAEGEISHETVTKLPYLMACLNEALRLYPPVPLGLPRVVPQGGALICGRHVPESSVVSIHQYAIYHREKYWTDPFGFHPERFLDVKGFENDDRATFQPFHLGSRGCLGRNLAYLESRLVLARLLWNFDLRIAEHSREWLNQQKVFNLWNKGPLDVFLTPVGR